LEQEVLWIFRRLVEMLTRNETVHQCTEDAALNRKVESLENYSKRLHYFVDYIPPMLDSILKTRAFDSLIDVGCGDGTLLNSMKNAGYFERKADITAVDISSDRLERVRGIDLSIRCFVNSAEDLDGVRDRRFDIVISTQVIEHVDDSKMMRQLSEILAPDGVIYLSTVFKKWYGWYFCRCNGRWVLDPTHLREYTDDRQLTRIIEENGLEVVESAKVPMRFPVTDLALRLLPGDHLVYSRHKTLSALRRFLLPIPGYYIWELVLRKKTGRPPLLLPTEKRL